MSENYPTHLARLWFDNDPLMYSELQDATEEYADNPYALAQWIKAYVETLAEDANLSDGLVTDLFNSAQGQIDYDALAQDSIRNRDEGNTQS